MKPLLSLICPTLPLFAVIPAQAAPAAATCQAQALAAIKQTAAYRHGSIREKQALLRSQKVYALTRACEARR